MVSFGLGLEAPRSTTLFLYVSTRATLLLPRVEVRTGEDDLPFWFFVETGLGVGLRWPG